MQPNKTKLALQIGAVVLGAMCASNSSADTFTATVNTVDDVTISPRAGQVLDFGPNIFVTPGGVCTLNVDNATHAPGGTLMNYASAGSLAEASTTFGSLTTGGVTSACASTTTAAAGGSSAGVWDLIGAPGVSVDILITDIAQVGDYTFVPNGCFVEYSGDSTTDGDDCTDIAANAADSAIFAAASEDDAGTGTGSGTSTEGQFSIAVGGVLTVGTTALDPATPYDLSFQIDVTY